MKNLINGLAVLGALNLVTFAALAAWLLGELLKGRRSSRDPRPLLRAVDSTRRDPVLVPVARTPSPQRRDRVWPD